MRIRRITAYAVKADQIYAMSGAATPGESLPGSNYLRLGPYPQLYSTRAQAALVRVETDEGLVGWGECQAPVGTEVVLTLISQVLGPAVVDCEAEATAVRYTDLYETLRVRGQTGGFQLDAIAGIDTALWDLRGKRTGLSIAELLGGRRRDTLPCYVTGLRQPTRNARQEEAARWAEEGFGVKAALGHGVRDDAEEAAGLRAAIGDEATLLVDGMWRYSYADAIRIGRAYDELAVGFFESPLPPEDIDGHARLAAKLDTPIAVGEPLRSRWAFLPWFRQAALDIAQPDQMRNGVTETVHIAALAEAFNLPVALHVGCSTVVGMAATWQIASTLPNMLIQEHQPVMLDTFNHWLDNPLTVANGVAHVPPGPGLGLRVDDERVAAQATSSVSVGA